MNKLKVILIAIILTFIFASCSKKEMGSTSYEYLIQEDVHSFNINWSFGTINFIDSKEFKIEETAENNIKNKDQLTYSIDNGTMTIKYKGRQTKTLNIYLDKDKDYLNLNIEGKDNIITCEKINIKYVNFSSNIGHFSITKCTFDEMNSNILCDNRQVRSSIISSTINNCSIIYQQIQEIFIDNCNFEDLSIKTYKTYVSFKKSKFSNFNLEQSNGTSYLLLDGNDGYMFQLLGKTIYLDMETINYNDYYFYKDAANKSTIKNKYGVIDIRRYY